MAHIIIEENWKSALKILKNLPESFVDENEVVLIERRDEINFPIIFRPHSRGIIVRIDNFPMFVDEDTIEEILIEVVRKTGLRAHFYNFRKSRLKALKEDRRED